MNKRREFGAVAVLFTEESQSYLRNLARHPVVHAYRILLEQDPTTEDFMRRYKRIIGFCHSVSTVSLLEDAQNQALLVHLPPDVAHDEHPLHVAISSTHGKETEVARFVEDVLAKTRLASITVKDGLLLVGTIQFLPR